MSNRSRRREDVAGAFDRDDEFVLDVDRVIVRADKVIIHADEIIIKSDDRRRNKFEDTAGVEDTDDRRKSRPFLNF